MKCSHPYLKKLSPDASVCIECGDVITRGKPVLKDEAALVMPPVIYELTPEYWEQIKPWPLMPFKVAKKYGWYVSMIYGRNYLVMPVFEKGGPVFYSARCLDHDCPKKYKYYTPENRKRRMWKSGGKSKYVLVGEGIADAAYVSQLARARALLGSYGELEEPHVIVVMDGDIKGIEASFRIVQAMRKRGIVDALSVMLPIGKDPTDIPIEKLRSVIEKQTGVKL